MDLPVVYEGKEFEITNENRLLVVLQAKPEKELIPLDDMILDETETLGWFIVTSRLVQWRMSQWMPSLFERFGAALAKWKSVRLGKRAAVVKDPGWCTFRSTTISELKASYGVVKKKIRLGIHRSDLARMWRQVVDDNQNGFGHLRAELESWLDFVADEHAPSNQLIAIIGRRQASMPLLFDEWWGFRTHRDPQNLSETISRLK
jgi:hypothetical protein